MAGLMKLMALDDADLMVVSALVQDAVLKVKDIEFDAAKKLLTLPMNRFAWEVPGARRWLFPKKERRLCALHFKRVKSVRSKNVDLTSSEEVLSLLAVQFEESGVDQDPSGTIVFTFSGGGAIEAEVECIEAQLADLGAAWSANRRPRHAGGEDL